MSGIARKALAVTVALALVAGVAHASESWSASKPWWCYDLANACGLWSSDVQYVGPTHSTCVGVTTGWKSETDMYIACFL